jgi:EAL domain-containing protein (putative c-di-GMP-specific phosphodiesterase class I)
MTETLLVTDVDAAADSLDLLKQLGVELAIDDFGTGYASLSYLSRFPIDVIKVDRSFVAAASGDGQAAVLARTILGLGSAIGVPTLAEGIEEPGQVAVVRDLGCRYGQGYLFARPTDARTTAKLLRGSSVPQSPPILPVRVMQAVAGQAVAGQAVAGGAAPSRLAAVQSHWKAN